MRKLSKITESVWSDIRQKSLGKDTRKQDAWIMELIQKFADNHNLKEDDYTINNDFSIDVFHSIQLQDKDLIDNKIPFKFGKIQGDFRISDVHLESLENSPEEVTGDFMITFTDIENLVGSPRIVGKNLNVNFNRKLSTLDGSPDKVGGDFKFFSSWIVKDISGISPEIGGNVICSAEHGTPRFSDDDFRRYSNIKGTIIRK